MAINNLSGITEACRTIDLTPAKQVEATRLMLSDVLAYNACCSKWMDSKTSNSGNEVLEFWYSKRADKNYEVLKHEESGAFEVYAGNDPVKALEAFYNN